MGSASQWLLAAVGATAIVITVVVALVQPADFAPRCASSPIAPLAAAPSALPMRATMATDQRDALPVRPCQRVVDALGIPVAGLAVRNTRTGVVVESDDKGQFLFDGDPIAGANWNDAVSGDAIVPAPGWIQVRSPLLDLWLPATANTLVAVPIDTVPGLVIDADGMPVAEAQLTWELEIDLPERRPLRGVRLHDWRTCTNSRGEFTLTHVPIGSSTRLCVQHPDFLPCVIEAPAPGQRLQLRLERPPAQPPIFGRVLDAQDQPLANARITVGLESTRSDERGEFCVPVAFSPAAALDISADGFEPFTTAALPRIVGTERKPLELRLRRVAAVSGHLVDAHGTPCAGWSVVLAKSATGPSAERFVGMPGRTLADGQFTLVGVDAESYRIEAWAPDSSGTVRSKLLLAPARNLLIDTTAMPLPERIVGVVRSSDGKPLPGVLVGLARPTAWAIRGHLALHTGARSISDARGHFEIVTGGVSALDLLVEGATCGVQRLVLDAARAAEPLDLVADGRRIEFPDVPAVLEGATLQAVDIADQAQPMAAVAALGLGVLPPQLAVGSYDVSSSTRAVIVRQQDRELGRLLLRHSSDHPREPR